MNLRSSLRWEFRVLQKNSEPGLKWLSETNSALFIGEGGVCNNFFIALLVQPNIVSLDLSVYKRKIQFMKNPVQTKLIIIYVGLREIKLFRYLNIYCLNMILFVFFCFFSVRTLHFGLSSRTFIF